MDVESARFIAAALAVLPLFGVGLGLGNLFANLSAAIARNPSAYDRLFRVGILGFAATEAAGLFSLLVAFMILAH